MLCEKHCEIMEKSKDLWNYEYLWNMKLCGQGPFVNYESMLLRAICEDQTYVAKGRLVTYEAMRPRAKLVNLWIQRAEGRCDKL